ncbi:MMPL family transporter [Pseudonocardia asaccharolytica]|uniref:MMPL family transporter n=1 Tax=Pseudonocardia asaccharolytica TaxID=54010 RepID=UPI00048D6DAF|nr:MMPL family transporter [Pseudonocardia asaccharolytica]
MSSVLYRLGRTAAHRRAAVLALWIALLCAVGGAAAGLGRGTDDAFAIPGSESQDALDYLGRVFPELSGASAQLVVVVPEGARVDTPAATATVHAAAGRIERVDQVAAVVDPFGEHARDAVSPDGRAAWIPVPLEVKQAEVTQATRDALTGIARDLQAQLGGGARVHAGGDAFAELVPSLGATEILGLVVALVVLVVLFRSFLAAGLPLLTAVVGVGVAAGLIYAATAVVPISSTAPMLAVMLGLAVGIDYALFILSRHRDQLAEGLDVEESIARAVATAGSAVVFAGLTVLIALLGLAVARIPFLTTMGIAAALGVSIGVLVAVTLVPALLAFVGARLRPRPARRRRLRLWPRRHGRARPPLGLRWVRLVTRAPLVTVLVVVAGLGLCTLPAADLRLALPDNGTQAEGSPARETYDVVARHFGPGYNGPLLVTVDILASTDPVGITEAVADEIRAVDGVASVPLAIPDPKAHIGIVQVVPTTAPDSAETAELVRELRSMQERLRERYGVDTAVTGITAVGIDVSAQLGRALLPFGILVVGLSLVLLAMVFRSITVPIKATAGYLLSVGAAFGATSFVFGQGHFADALHVTRPGSVISFLPIILMGVLFGLAMDYEVFLVSRMREHYAHNGDPEEAIESGFVSVSRVVVAAALIMFVVFASFVPEGTTTIKPIAFSLAVGVFVDAFVVRMTLVPAVLALLGRRAWWLPAWLDRRLPVFDAEGDALVHELRLADWPGPGSREVVSARDLRVADDRGRAVFDGVEIHLGPGEVLGIHGSGPCGKTALLAALGGRVTTVEGDLKVCGKVLPQHGHAVRARVALVACRDTADPAGEIRRALVEGAPLVLLDDLDTVVRVEQRRALRDLLAEATGTSTAVVFTCQSPALLRDVLPVHRAADIALSVPALEVA